MKTFKIYIVVILLVAAGTVFTTWYTSRKDPIVGAWFVKAQDAPFQYHMFLFNADGTMEQANPDAGNPDTSDGDGKGVWVRKGDKVEGKFAEATANRKTHKFASRGEISFEIETEGDKLTGQASARFFDIQGKLLRGPLPTPLEGDRVTLP